MLLLLRRLLPAARMQLLWAICCMIAQRCRKENFARPFVIMVFAPQRNQFRIVPSMVPAGQILAEARVNQKPIGQGLTTHSNEPQNTANDRPPQVQRRRLLEGSVPVGVA